MCKHFGAREPEGQNECCPNTSAGENVTSYQANLQMQACKNIYIYAWPATSTGMDL